MGYLGTVVGDFHAETSMSSRRTDCTGYRLRDVPRQDHRHQLVGHLIALRTIIVESADEGSTQETSTTTREKEQLAAAMAEMTRSRNDAMTKGRSGRRSIDVCRRS